MLLNVRRRYRPEKSGLTEAECEALNICDAIALKHTGRHLDGTEELPKPESKAESALRNKIARRLREARAGRYIEDVARDCEISISAMAMYETGRRIPRDPIKKRLADHYGKTVQELFYDD